MEGVPPRPAAPPRRVHMCMHPPRRVHMYMYDMYGVCTTSPCNMCTCMCMYGVHVTCTACASRAAVARAQGSGGVR